MELKMKNFEIALSRQYSQNLRPTRFTQYCFVIKPWLSSLICAYIHMWMGDCGIVRKIRKSRFPLLNRILDAKFAVRIFRENSWHLLIVCGVVAGYGLDYLYFHPVVGSIAITVNLQFSFYLSIKWVLII